ncbi:MAG: replication protein [Armatimonadetes bacterium]|nr:replication protein [Armatimonadota bacterium]
MTRALIPNSTPVPDVILDFWLALLTGAEVKVVLYVARRTYGFGKASDRISLSQLAGGIRRRDGTVLDTGTGLSRSTVKAACSSLVKRGMLLKESNTNEFTRECAESTYRLNLEWTSTAWPRRDTDQVGRVPAQVQQKANGGVGRVLTHVGQTTVDLVGRNPALQETEHIQETAASGEGKSTAPAAELVEKLVAAGLNGADAVRLARSKPLECERQLAFLAYRVKTSFPFKRDKGAFLRRAIEDAFAPPNGYNRVLQAKADDAKGRASQAEAVARRSALREQMRQTLETMQHEQPARYLGFLSYVDQKRQEAVGRPILAGAPEVRRRVVECFDAEETRLELLAEFLGSQSPS